MHNGNGKVYGQAAANGRMSYNLVTLTGIVDTEITFLEYQPGKHLALFTLKFQAGQEMTTMTVATYRECSRFCHQTVRKGSTIVIKGNLNLYHDKLQIIANSIEVVDPKGNVVNSVKKESHKEWPGGINGSAQ